MFMADSTKYMPINGGTLVSDLKLKNLFLFRTKRTRAFAYVFISIFIGFTVFLAFNPSDPSSPWFSSIFNRTNIIIPSSSSSNSNSTSIQANGTISSSSSSSDTNGSVKSKSSSFYSSIFSSNSSSQIRNSTIFSSSTNSSITRSHDAPAQFVQNQNRSEDLRDKFEVPKLNQTTKTAVNASSEVTPSSISEIPISMAENATKTQELAPTSSKNVTKTGDDEKVEAKSSSGEDLVKKLGDCNLFDGEWVRDESYPLYKAGSCSLIDEQFNCFSNGRPDNGYQKLKWKPKGCSLPRLDGSHMLQLLRGKRLVFVGDSLNRNMWESLICILRNSVKNRTAVYEASGSQQFRSEPSYSFVFKDYDCTIEFFVAPFIVREWEMKEKNGTKETLRLDLIGSSADQYKNADIVIFNTGHWWTHDKTAKGQDYYQEGSHVYGELNVLEAFRKAMTTWGRWVDANINPRKTSVFFRGYSASHFSGGQWNSGGACDNEIEPIKNTTYLTPYLDKMMVLEKVLRGMKIRVSYLNVTRLTDFRKDGHPSIYRKQHYTEEERKSPLHYQDCSHWCLPGVPDAWNEILYAQLLSKQYQNQHQNLRK